MTARGYRPGPEKGRAELFDEHETLQARVEIVAVGGQEGAALRSAQARVIRELLMWAGDEYTDETTTTNPP